MPARSAGARAGRRAISCSRTAASIAGCAPCYLKSHSQGEYVFDHGWADAFMQAGGDYYPKLQIAVPFTPVPGPAAAGAARTRRRERTRRMLAAGAARARRAQRHLGRAHHLPQRRRMEPARRRAASCSAPTSSSTGAMPATAPSTTSWPRSPRASARPCARSASRRWRRASRSSGCAAARSREARLGRVLRVLHGDRARASGAGPISTASSSRCSAPAPWASAAC